MPRVGLKREETSYAQAPKCSFHFSEVKANKFKFKIAYICNEIQNKWL